MAEKGTQAEEDEHRVLDMRRDLLGPRAICSTIISLFPVPFPGWTLLPTGPWPHPTPQALGKGERRKRAAGASATSCWAFALPTTSCVCKADALEADKTQASGPPAQPQLQVGGPCT